MAYLFRAVGLISTRTAGRELPPSWTCPTPLTWLIFCCRMLDAASNRRPWPKVLDVSAITMTGASAGLILRYCGLLRRSVGMSARAALIAACTSRAAPSMSRDRSNCRMMRELPTVLDEVISETPAMAPSRRSSGVVTLVATVSGEAPGRLAETEMVGKSTLGSGETGSLKKATNPANARPIVSRVVATGRAMKGADRFTVPPRPPRLEAGGAAYRAAGRAGDGPAGRRRDRSPAS
jgi:hypothetical protein